MSSDTLDLEEIGSEDDLRGYEPIKPGQYHVIVEEVDNSRDKVDALKVKFQILAGTVEGQVGKTFNETLWMPSGANKDGGKFATRRLATLALRAGLIAPEHLGKKGVPINWDDLKARQLIVKVKSSKDPKYVEVDGLEFHAVDDPDQKHVPIDEETAAMAGKSRSANGSAKSAANKPARGTKVEVDNL